MNKIYLEESKGTTKVDNYCSFLIKNVNKNIYDYMNKILNEDFNKKIRNMDFQMKILEEEIEDLDTENKRLEDNIENKLDYVIK